MALSLVWLRRDLRLYDHAAFAEAFAQDGQVQPIFIFDRDILAQFSNPYDRRLSFITETLAQMHSALQKRGGGLLVLCGSARQIVPTLARALSATCVCYAKDVEPSAIARDEAVKHALPKTINVISVIDHLLRAPDQALKNDGTPFKVFTPYSKAWRASITPLDTMEYPFDDKGRYADIAENMRLAHASGLKVLDPSLGASAMLEAIGYKYVTDPLWRVDDVRTRLSHFVESKIHVYKESRDFVAESGTSALSPYLRFGLLSVRECMRLASAHTGIGAYTWVNELIWRDFYAMILAHNPHVVDQEMQPQYRRLNWSRDTDYLQRFIEGKTGFPIVDAAMRQLLAEGWMHNRARMIVASFMTKDLRLDWRLGEAHFAQWLMDYDLASNNGGWQWAASTGTDAQPYFRIFNPWLQSVRFDPHGRYIRRYVSELAHLSDADIHEPVGLMRPSNYPLPMVDHHKAKEAAIALFKDAKSGA